MALSQLSRYYLQLHFSPSASVEVYPENFALAPCRYAKQRSEAEKRFRRLAIFPAPISIIFFIGALLWFATRKAEDKSARFRACKFIERFLVVPYRNWLGILLVFMIPLAVGILYLERAAFSVCVGLTLSLFLFVLEKFKKSPTALLLYFTIEFLVLPFLHLLVSRLG
jgi:hypothetical protein